MTRQRRRDRGQALVEFALAGTLFILIVIAFFDVGFAVFKYNGVAEAAREIARTTSIYPGGPLGSSPQTAATLAAQRAMIPGLSTPTFSCVNDAGTAVTTDCAPGNLVLVTIQARYDPATPLVNLIGPITLSSSASSQIQ